MNKQQYNSLCKLFDLCSNIRYWNNHNDAELKINVTYTSNDLVFDFTNEDDAIVTTCYKWVTRGLSPIQIITKRKNIKIVKKFLKETKYFVNANIKGSDVLGTIPAEAHKMFDSALTDLAQQLDTIYEDAYNHYQTAMEARGKLEFGLSDDAYYTKVDTEPKLVITANNIDNGIISTFKCPLA